MESDNGENIGNRLMGFYHLVRWVALAVHVGIHFNADIWLANNPDWVGFAGQVMLGVMAFWLSDPARLLGFSRAIISSRE